MATTDLRPAFRPGPTDRVAVAAGSGRLPIDIVESLVQAGHRPFVVVVEGEADAQSPTLRAQDHWIMPLEHVGDLVGQLRRAGVTHVVSAGGIGRRPRLRNLRPSIGLLRMAYRVAASLARGDDSLLRALTQHLETSGLTVLGVHDILPDLLAPAGPLTRRHARGRDLADLRAAAIAARAIGALDIGQAAVAIGGRAVALEGIEGTDGLLARTRDLRSNGRIAGQTGGVLVKCAKPQQEVRADLPTVGIGTLENAHAAGLAGIGVEAGRSIILEQEQMLRRADELGLFVVGLTEADWTP